MRSAMTNIQTRLTGMCGKEAQETMGVEFVYDVDKEAFREATQPMIEAYEEQYPGVKTLMDTIEAAREGE